jgi:YbbR domain-containing protein
MFKKIADSKWFYVVLSILMSIMLWGYVIRDLNPDQTKKIDRIPITFVGTDVLDTRQLIITGGEDQTIDLRVSAKLDVLSRLSRDNINMEVNVTRISEPGDYRILVSHTFPPNVQAGSVTIENDVDDLYVTVTVAKREAKEIPIKAEFTGSVAEGHQLGDIVVTPVTISISGQQEMVNRVAYAKVILSQENMDTTYTGDLPFVYIGADGKELTDLKVASNVDTVHVSFPIVIVKEIPLTVTILPGGGAAAEHVKLTFGAKDLEDMTIDVSGAEEDMEGLERITIGEIDLSKVVTSKEFTFPINLADGLTNESGITEVTVKATIKNLTTRELDVDNIQLINVPAGYTAEAVTQARTVMIRGKSELVNAIFKSQLRIVVDVSAGITEAAIGRYDIPAKVYLDGSSDVGVVGSYNISVSLSR